MLDFYSVVDYDANGTVIGQVCVQEFYTIIQALQKWRTCLL